MLVFVVIAGFLTVSTLVRRVFVLLIIELCHSTERLCFQRLLCVFLGQYSMLNCLSLVFFCCKSWLLTQLFSEHYTRPQPYFWPFTTDITHLYFRFFFSLYFLIIWPRIVVYSSECVILSAVLVFLYSGLIFIVARLEWTSDCLPILGIVCKCVMNTCGCVCMYYWNNVSASWRWTNNNTLGEFRADNIALFKMKYKWNNIFFLVTRHYRWMGWNVIYTFPGD